MTALLNAAHHALTHTAPVPEAAMFAAPWVILLAVVVIYRAAAAAWCRVRGGSDGFDTLPDCGWLDERAGVEVWHVR